MKLDSVGKIAFSTYLPMAVYDAVHNLAVDAAGNPYIIGSAFVEEGDTFFSSQMILLKISADGSQLILGRHIGGIDADLGAAIAVDPTGNVYLAGTTEDESFPITANAHQSVCGEILFQRRSYCFRDGIVVVLDSTGQTIYSSYHGGSFSDQPQAIATDGRGHILVAGNTESGLFPLVNPLQGSCPIDPSSGDCRSLYGFVSVIELSADAAKLTYSTYLGSAERGSTNVVKAAAMDGAGNSYIAGYTNGTAFPLAQPVQSELSDSFCTTFGAQRLCHDAFVAKLTATGMPSFGSYLGATFDDIATDIAVHGGGIYLTGYTEADDFPITADAFQPNNQISDDGFLVRFGGGSGPVPSQPVGNKRLYLPVVER